MFGRHIGSVGNVHTHRQTYTYISKPAKVIGVVRGIKKEIRILKNKLHFEK